MVTVQSNASYIYQCYIRKFSLHLVQRIVNLALKRGDICINMGGDFGKFIEARNKNFALQIGQNKIIQLVFPPNQAKTFFSWNGSKISRPQLTITWLGCAHWLAIALPEISAVFLSAMTGENAHEVCFVYFDLLSHWRCKSTFCQ